MESRIKTVFSFFYFLGYIRDKTDYVVTLHCLNLATYFVAICWIGEKVYRSHQERKLKTAKDTSNCDYQKANEVE